MVRSLLHISLSILLCFCALSLAVAAQVENSKADSTEKAETIIKRAVQNLGGEKYLQIKTQVGKGTYSMIREGALASFQSFVDVIVFPDKERTDFKGRGS